MIGLQLKEELVQLYGIANLLSSLHSKAKTVRPQFYLILAAEEVTENLADSVYEAGFDDSSLIMRGRNAAIWIRHRQGELNELVREALGQAKAGGLSVSHIAMDSDAFEQAQ